MLRVLLFFLPLFSLFAKLGLEYSQMQDPKGESTLHLIEVDPALYEIKPMKALDDGIGRESVLSIAARSGAVASVNGGFFSIGGTLDGRACGALKIHDWFALPFKPRGCMGWSSREQIPVMDRLLVRAVARYRGESFSVDGLNRSRKEGEILLFTPCFHRTTLTCPDGEELVIVDGQIQSIMRGGSTKIPAGGSVLSIQEKHPLFHNFAVGEALEVFFEVTPLLGELSSWEWDQFDYIVGGVPLLLHGGARMVDFTSEQTIPTFLSNRHARTAVGLLPNGHWLFVVADRNETSLGMTMAELSELMARFGCVEALNLDGGGSSTMVYEGEVKNSPQGDEDEGANCSMIRRVSDAIVILPKKP